MQDFGELLVVDERSFGIVESRLTLLRISCQRRIGLLVVPALPEDVHRVQDALREVDRVGLRNGRLLDSMKRALERLVHVSEGVAQVVGGNGRHSQRCAPR